MGGKEQEMVSRNMGVGVGRGTGAISHVVKNMY